MGCFSQGQHWFSNQHQSSLMEMLFNGYQSQNIKGGNLLEYYMTIKKMQESSGLVYIERNCELLQEFPMAHPEIKCKVNGIYNCSFPGSILWDLTAQYMTQLINSWSVYVRHMWELPVNSFFDMQVVGHRIRSE